MISEPARRISAWMHADGIAGRIVGAEGVGADEFGKAVGLVGIRAAHAAHFVQDDRHAGVGDLPGGFRAGKAAADDVDGRIGRGLCSCAADITPGENRELPD